MKESERALMAALSDANNFEDFFEADYADAPLVSPTSKGVGAQLANLRGNPRFAAQFDLSVKITYIDVTGAANIAYSALPAGLQTSLRFPVFGNSDFAGGFKLFKERFSIGPETAGTWAFVQDGIAGRDNVPAPGAGTVTYAVGDLFIKFTATVAANAYEAWVVLNCRQVAYGTLLSAISSDRFVINNIRYLIADSTKVNQYDNQIGILRQTLFGKVSNDWVSPASFKKPEQFQTNVVDVPLRKGVDKETLLGSHINYDCVDLTWSVFVMTVNKVQEKL